MNKHIEDSHIKTLRNDIREAEKDLDHYIIKQYPVGTTIYWEKNGYIQTGIVQRHLTDRIEVENTKTKLKYIIYVDWIRVLEE